MYKNNCYLFIMIPYKFNTDAIFFFVFLLFVESQKLYEIIISEKIN